MADPIVSELEEFYRSYIERFNGKDLSAFLRVFAYPNAVLTGEQGLSVHAGEAEMATAFRQFMNALQARGWDHSRVNALQVHPLSDALALLVADYTRYRADGSVLEPGRACYMVRREEGGWKVLTLAEARPPYSDASGSR
jgi:ketosteroid isomerase-like protein